MPLQAFQDKLTSTHKFDKTLISTEKQKTWQQTLLTVMMIINLLVLCGLLWRIHSNQKQQQTTINSVLQNYAAMAGQKFVGAIKSKIGYGSMYLLSQSWASSDDPTNTISNYMSRPNSDLLPTQIMVRDALTNIQVINTQALSSKTIDHPQLNSNLSSIPELDTVNNYGFIAIHKNPAEDLSFSSLLIINPKYAVLVSYSDDFVKKAMALIFESQTMLPTVLTTAENNNGLGFMMHNQNNQLLWQSQPQAGEDNRFVISIDDDYGSLFEGFKMSAAIESSLAASLIIGGLPKSQMPQLLLMIGASLIAMLTMYWLHRKSHLLNQQKEQFIARASHELKTPLTQIRLFAETMTLNRVDNSETKNQYMQIILKESIRLSQLVDNILNQHQIEQGQVNLAPENIKILSFIKDLIAQQQILWQKKTISTSIDISKEITLSTDPNLLKQALINVLDNAVKFGPDEQTITITGHEQDQTLAITIKDQGPGIPSQNLNQVMQAYQRLSRDENRGINGNGLGLFITEKLIQQLNGKLHIDSNTSGTCVMISLPLKIGFNTT